MKKKKIYKWFQKHERKKNTHIYIAVLRKKQQMEEKSTQTSNNKKFVNWKGTLYQEEIKL